MTATVALSPSTSFGFSCTHSRVFWINGVMLSVKSFKTGISSTPTASLSPFTDVVSSFCASKYSADGVGQVLTVHDPKVSPLLRQRLDTFAPFFQKR